MGSSVLHGLIGRLNEALDSDPSAYLTIYKEGRIENITIENILKNDLAYAYILTPSETEITEASVPVAIAGVYGEIESKNFSIESNGKITYTGNFEKKFKVTVSLTIDPASGSKKVCNTYIDKNGSVLGSSASIASVDNSNPESIYCQAIVSLEKNDFIRVCIENTTDTVNLEVSKMTIIIQ